MQPIHVTTYRGARAPAPIGQDDHATWDDLADEIEGMTRDRPLCAPTLPADEQKLYLLAFAPHRLREPYRNTANVIEVTFGVIDVDHFAEGDTPKALVARVCKWSERGLIYASPSDAPDARRVRICVPFAHPHAPDACRNVRLLLAESFGLAPGCGVEGAIDAAKLFFAGRLHGTPEREIWRW